MSQTLLDIDTTRIELPDPLLDAPGGFAWWYVDWWDEDRNGAVFIWSFGLPFLPGLVDASRRGRPTPAGARPSLNVALYERGRPSFYLLQEYPAEEASWEGGAVRLGASTLHTSRVGDERVVELDIDCPIPRSLERLTGTFRARGPAVHHASEPPRGDGHMWTPLLVGCEADMALRSGPQTLIDGSGRVYHDRNGCPQSIETLGIERWLWGRAALPEGERIWYLLWGKDGRLEAHVLDVGPSGLAIQLPDITVELSAEARCTFGLTYPRSVELRSRGELVLVVEHTELVDDGPFYLRMHASVVTADGQTGHGSGELLVPDRVDLGWQRPFVSMAVHHTAKPNSMWLPLFSGPTAGRWQRLLGLGSWAGWPVPVRT